MEDIGRKSGIYRIKCVTSAKDYVGGAANMGARWRNHRNSLRSGSHHNKHLQNAWNKYGEPSFEFSVLEYVQDKEQLTVREQHWMDELKVFESGYNIFPYARSPRGRYVSPETRERMGAWQRGLKRKPLSQEQRIKMGEALWGEQNAAAKLTLSEVEVIRSEYKGPRKGPTLKSLASKHNVSIATIHRVVTETTWNNH